MIEILGSFRLGPAVLAGVRTPTILRVKAEGI